MPDWLNQIVSRSWSFVAGVRLYVWGLVAAFALGALFGGCTCSKFRDVVGEPPADEARSFGWLDEPDQVRQIVATFRQPFFGDAARQLIERAEEKDAFLWLAYEKVNGRPWPAHDQDGTGCCVGEGFSAAVEILTCVDIATGNGQWEYKPISAAAIYALSREVAGILGRGDGSFGAAAAKALMQFGAVSCEEAKDDNTTGREHAALAKKWGRSGLPSELKELAAKHKIGSAAQVRTPEEVRAALTNGYPVAICSSVGFEPFRRDRDGFCKPGETWPHCMVIVGYRQDKRAFLVLQSWGESVPPGPKTLGQPDCSFWITWDACQRIVRSGESYALSAWQGYPARNVDWFARLLPRHDETRPALRLARFSLAP